MASDHTTSSAAPQTSPAAPALPSPNRRQFLRAGIGLAAGALAVGSALRASAAPAAARESLTGVKAIYLNPAITDVRTGLGPVLDLIERTELNALVIDIKDDSGVYFRSRVDLFRDAGAIQPRYDVSDLLDALHARDIRAIARLVCFKDGYVPTARPDLAIIDTRTGRPWQDAIGQTWLNAFQEENQIALADLAAEAASLGFDEIQYDYVRFPSDGNLSIINLGQESTEATRTAAISTLLEMTRERLAPIGAALAADIFGWSLVIDGDNGIGQTATEFGAAVDVFCPMVYPSHWGKGSLAAIPGHPNDYPAETIAISMAAAREKLGGQTEKLRPWLQGFSLPNMRPYGAAEVRLQIDAAEAAGASGWMVWNLGTPVPESAFRLA